MSPNKYKLSLEGLMENVAVKWSWQWAMNMIPYLYDENNSMHSDVLF